jgi:hypothetical protein
MDERERPSEQERANALLIVGLLCAATTPIFIPAVAAALAIGVVLARRRFVRHAFAVLAASALVLGGTLAAAT